MNWDAIGAVGEAGGAIAVVATLVYLARQIRHSSLSARASTTLDASRLVAETLRGLGQTPDLADIWARGMSEPDSLSDQEVPRFTTLNAEMFHVSEGMWRQWKLGLVADETMRPLDRYLVQLLTSPHVAAWFDSKIDILSEEFREYVSELRKKDADPGYGQRVRDVRLEKGSS